MRVFGVDYERLGDAALAHTVFVENRCYLKMDGGHCSALTIDPVARRFSCSIYDVRPDVCRSLERGTGSCRGEWEAKAGRPDVAIERLRVQRS